MSYASGERAIRYQGVDEAYAVNELYQRLKSEIADQKEHRAEVKYSSRSATNNNAKSSSVDWLNHVLNIPKYVGIF